MSSPPSHTTPLRFLAAVLATHRLTRLVTQDTITEPARERIFAVFGDPSTKHTSRERVSLSYLVSCPHCASIYTALFTTLLAYAPLPRPARRLADALLSTLALSGAISAAHDAADAIPKPGGWA